MTNECLTNLCCKLLAKFLDYLLLWASKMHSEVKELILKDKSLLEIAK
jgi:hypothetical protein